MVLPRDHYDPYTGETTSADPPPGDTGEVVDGKLTPTGPILKYFTEFSRYPGNNKQWWVAKADLDDPDAVPPYEAGDFLPEVLNKLWAGNNRVAQGHYVLDAFNKDRSAVSGVPNLPVEVTDERPPTVTFFSGRVWYACNSTVYFSQVLTERHKAGMCYQEADPTAEGISDLIATDGGVVPIPEANKIVRIIPNGGGILVFAINGVWNITGTNAGFSALDISVNKISPVGCKSPMSVVETDTAVLWWSDAGILGISQSSGMYGPIPGAFDRTNISQETIQSYYNAIPEEAKEDVKGVYDAENNTVLWLFRDDDVTNHQYNTVLNFDLSLGAFYPWKVSKLEDVDAPRLKGFCLTTVNDQNINSYIKYISMTNESLTFGQFSSKGFVDWDSVPYDSYVETGYELFNDAMRKKAITYIFTYLRRTEALVNPDGTEDDPSSCYLTIKFDWANTGKSNKWTTPVQVYRPGRFILPEEDGSIDTGFPIVITKSKVRGNGKSIQFRFGTNEPGRNFDLSGWSISATGNTVP